MRSLLASTLLVGLSALAPVFAHDMDFSNCKVEDLSIKLASQEQVGNDAGQPYCTSKINEGILPNELECWADAGGVRGLKFHYTDGSSIMIGADWATNGRHGHIKWDPSKERLERLSLWGGSWINGLARIDVKVKDKDDDFGSMDCGMDRGDWGQSDYNVDLGRSGLMLGAVGGHSGKGGSVDNIRFLFSQEAIKNVTIDQMEWPEFENIEIDPNVAEKTDSKIDEAVYANGLSNQTVQVHYKTTTIIETDQEFSTTDISTFGFGSTISVEADLPEIAKIATSLETKFEMSNQRTSTVGYHEKREMEIGFEPVEVEPESAIVFKQFATKGELKDAKYRARLRVEMKDGSFFHYFVDGKYSSVSYVKTTQSVDEMDFAEAMGLVNSGSKTPEESQVKPVPAKAQDAVKPAAEPATTKLARRFVA